jgi:hypothetical protein
MADEKKTDAKRLAKVERVHFNTSFFERGVAKYEAGKHYPRTPETERRVAAGDAEIRNVEMDADDHAAEHAAANAAHKAANRATLEAEEIARKRGELK